MSALPVPQPEDSDKHLPIDSKLIGKINKTPKVPFNSDQVRGLRRKGNGVTGYMVIPLIDGDFNVEDVVTLPDVYNALNSLIRKASEKK
jgi:hypothetical protein